MSTKQADPSVLKEEFEDLGYELSVPSVIDGLLALCDIYGLSEERLSCLYLTHSSETPASKDELTAFETQVLLPLKNSSVQKAKGGSRSLHDATSLKKLQALHQRNHEDDDLIALSYGQTSKTDKILSTPEKSSVSVPIEVNSPFCQRKNSGETLTRFGFVGKSPSLTRGSTHDLGAPALLSPLTRPYSFMFERLRESAGILDEIICRQADVLLEKYPEELGPSALEGDISLVNTEVFASFGRICCEASEGRMNARSVLLQGSMDASGGRSVPLDISSLKDYSLFPGQIVGIRGTNPHGGRLVAQSIYTEGSLPMSSKTKKSKARREISLIVASGPFTTKDDLTYAPLKELLKQIRNDKPEAVILCGPFLDERHSLLSGGSKENQDSDDVEEESYDSIFAQRVIKPILEVLEFLPDTHILIVPSARDIHHLPIYPTPPFDSSQSNDRIHMLSDPCLFTLEGIIFGVTSTDILFHMSKNTISAASAGSMDRMKRLAKHLLDQRNFYPLYPPCGGEMSVDMERIEQFCRMEQRPDVLILPSDLMHFIKDVDGTLVLNPSRLSRGTGGGVFSKINIRNNVEESVVKNTFASIVRI